jgi:hypothetical protein
MKDMRQTYARVVIVWIITLSALFVFQQYFTS